MALVKRGKIWWIDFYHNGKRYRLSTKTSDKKKAEEIYIKVLLRLNSAEKIQNVKYEQGITQTESSMSYEEFYEKHYLKYCYKRHKTNIEVYFFRSLPDWFKKLKLNQIGTQEVEQLQSYFIQKEMSVATCNRYIGIVKSSFSKACDWNFITETRLKAIRKVKLLKGETKRLRYLTMDEIHRLLSCCDDHLYPIVFTAINTGMRKGEILNLKWSNVDLKNGIILVEKTKNNERREIPMNDSLKALFRRLYSQRRLDTEYVFINPQNGKRYVDLKKSFNTACKKAGLKDFHFHDLRHTFASQLVMSGVDLKTVQELLGHKTINMTLRYAHLSEAHKKEAVKTLETKLGHNLVTVSRIK
ncbi:MAG: site-specific integrase [Thermodesulfovibrio sp.]